MAVGTEFPKEHKEKSSFHEEWEHIHQTEEWGAYPSEYVIRFIARNYYKKERESVKMLDFGCGAGAHTWYMAREGFDVYAFDGSESAVEKAKRRMEKENLKAHFQVSDALALDYSDGFFDAVVDSACIYANLLDHIRQMYRNIYHILKPQGKLFTNCFGKQTEGYGTGELLEEGTYVNMTKGVLQGRAMAHFYTKGELKEVLDEAGFSNIQIDSVLYTDRGITVEQFIATAVK